MIERYDVADPDRAGILGGLYGGYLTSWAIGHTDRFAAACSERAANNLVSLEWSSDARVQRAELILDWFRRRLPAPSEPVK